MQTQTFRYFETADFSIGLSEPPWRTKSRIFILEPQRMFADALMKALADDFDVIGSAAQLEEAPDQQAVDLVLIDTDAFGTLAPNVVALAGTVFDCAALCLLSVLPPTLQLANVQSKGRYYLSKSVSQLEFVNALREVALRSRIES